MANMTKPLGLNPPKSVEWIGGGDGKLRLIDQTMLPGETCFVDCKTVEDAWEAIVMLRVRGAPAIGIAAAYATLLSLTQADSVQIFGNLPRERALKAIDYLATSRPTAVNLFWALDRMKRALLAIPDSRTTAFEIGATLLLEARAIHDEDRDMCRAIGRHGASLIESGMGLLTHCNTGGLATSEYGTALAAFFTAQDEGKSIHVYADETRPLLQGARLTMWELMQRDIPCTLVCDSMAAQVMREGRIQAIFVGADRITACGDTANKIGTYSVAILAKHHGIPFYVAAPSSTFDLSIEQGENIPIEQRKDSEITEAFGKRTAPLNAKVYNPAFDVTPAELITAIVTEKGIIRPVDKSSIASLIA